MKKCTCPSPLIDQFVREHGRRPDPLVERFVRECEALERDAKVLAVNVALGLVPAPTVEERARCAVLLVRFNAVRRRMEAKVAANDFIAGFEAPR